jgi:hypothetical protein
MFELKGVSLLIVDEDDEETDLLSEVLANNE